MDVHLISEMLRRHQSAICQLFFFLGSASSHNPRLKLFYVMCDSDLMNICTAAHQVLKYEPISSLLSTGLLKLLSSSSVTVT